MSDSKKELSRRKMAEEDGIRYIIESRKKRYTNQLLDKFSDWKFSRFSQ